jgi:hypothetical protein
MEKVFRIYLIILFVDFYVTGNAQTTLLCDTVPYDIIEGKMVITAETESKPVRYILDTGGRNLITTDSAHYYHVGIVGNEAVADVNNKGRSMYKGVLPNLKIGKTIELQNVNMLVMPPQNYFRAMGVAGALGSEAFTDVCISIHSREKYLIVTYPFRPKGISRKDGTPMHMTNNRQPLIPVEVGGITIHAFFDTGMSGFLHLNDADYETLKKAGNYELIAHGSGLWFVGVGGVNDIHNDVADKITVPDWRVTTKRFINAGTLTQNRHISIVGLGLIEYGNVILDYPRGLFYYFPFDSQTDDLSAKTKIWNVNILPVDDHFEVTGTLGEIDVKRSERVWNINGTDLKSMPPSELLITEILNNIKEDTAHIFVGIDADNPRKVIIKRI